MNICIESHLLNHPRRSGVMTYTEGLVKGLCAHDHENDYTLLYYSLRRTAMEMPGPVGGNFKKEVLRMPDRTFSGRQLMLDKIFLPGYLRTHKMDIFHRTVGYTMPESKKVFKVLTVHDLRTLTIGDRWAAQNIRHYKNVLSKIDLCVVVSECTKKDLLEHMGMDEKKIRVVYLGVDERYQPAAMENINAVRRKYQINDPYFLSVGSVPRKNIDGIIRGFAGCRYKEEFQLVLNCKIDLDKYTQLAKELEVIDRIVFVNNVSDDELVALYSGCRCFVFPSLYEGFGLPILEAMSCGAPVITSNLSACPEVAGDAALLVDPSNPKAISGAMDQVGSDAAFCQSLRMRGFEQAKKFSWKNFAMRMKDIYAAA